MTELDTDADLRTPDEKARYWLEHVYQGDHVRQLSVRSIVTGMLIGGVMSVSNLYVGLKTGWGLGVTITACIIAYAVFNVLERIVPRWRNDPFTILENYTMSSAASAAGYMSSAGLVSAFPALLLVTGERLEWWKIMPWLGAVSVLGVFMAIPLKRQLINIDELPFPSGIATAETLRSMHTAGVEAMRKAKALFIAGIGGALLKLWVDGGALLVERLRSQGDDGFATRLSKLVLPEQIPLLPGRIGERLQAYTINFEGSLIMVAAGAIMGMRVAASVFVGSILFFGVIAPRLVAGGIVAEPSYRNIVHWTLWPATAMMVTSGLLSFALKWKTVLRAFSGLSRIFGRSTPEQDAIAHIEVPGWWFGLGTFVAGAACVVMGHYWFEITWWMGILAVALTFLLSIVAARATGETDVTPIGAMGKITQLTYGALTPKHAATNVTASLTTNLMTASITAGAASHSADLLTDLKSGYLLGGNPRKQTISQLFGVLAGTLVCVPIYQVIVDPEKLGSPELPAPSAKVWEGVARALVQGFDGLPRYAIPAIIVGAVLGVVLTLAEEWLPRRFRPYIPSATGLGLAGVIPAFNSISMFIGAAIAWSLERTRPETHERYTVPVSSGLIAGESLMGVFFILLINGPGLLDAVRRLFGGS